MNTDIERMESLLRQLEENVVFILDVLASAEPVREAVNSDHENVPAQYVIEEHEINKAKEMLRKHGIWS